MRRLEVRDARAAWTVAVFYIWISALLTANTPSALAFQARGSRASDNTVAGSRTTAGAPARPASPTTSGHHPVISRRQLAGVVAVQDGTELLEAIRNPNASVILLTRSISIDTPAWRELQAPLVVSWPLVILGGGRYSNPDRSPLVSGPYHMLDLAHLANKVHLLASLENGLLPSSSVDAANASAGALQFRGLWLRNHMPPTGYDMTLLSAVPPGVTVRFEDCLLERYVGAPLNYTEAEARLLEPVAGQPASQLSLTPSWCPPPAASAPAAPCFAASLTYSSFAVEVASARHALDTAAAPVDLRDLTMSYVVVIANSTYGVRNEVSSSCMLAYGVDYCVYHLQGQLQTLPPSVSPPQQQPAAGANAVGGESCGGGLSPAASAGIAVGATLAGCLALLLLVRFVGRIKKGHRTFTLAVRPPGATPTTTLLITDIQNSTNLWEQLPTSVMNEALRLHHRCLRSLLPKCNGYESATEGDSFILAFHNPMDAVRFALLAQQALMELTWPLELLEHEDGREVWAEPARPKVAASRFGIAQHLHPHARGLGSGQTIGGMAIASQPGYGGLADDDAPDDLDGAPSWYEGAAAVGSTQPGWLSAFSAASSKAGTRRVAPGRGGSTLNRNRSLSRSFTAVNDAMLAATIPPRSLGHNAGGGPTSTGGEISLATLGTQLPPLHEVQKTGCFDSYAFADGRQSLTAAAAPPDVLQRTGSFMLDDACPPGATASPEADAQIPVRSPASKASRTVNVRELDGSGILLLSNHSVQSDQSAPVGSGARVSMPRAQPPQSRGVLAPRVPQSPGLMSPVDALLAAAGSSSNFSYDSNARASCGGASGGAAVGAVAALAAAAAAKSSLKRNNTGSMGVVSTVVESLTLRMQSRTLSIKGGATLPSSRSLGALADVAEVIFPGWGAAADGGGAGGGGTATAAERNGGSSRVGSEILKGPDTMVRSNNPLTLLHDGQEEEEEEEEEEGGRLGGPMGSRVPAHPASGGISSRERRGNSRLGGSGGINVGPATPRRSRMLGPVVVGSGSGSGSGSGLGVGGVQQQEQGYHHKGNVCSARVIKFAAPSLEGTGEHPLFAELPEAIDTATGTAALPSQSCSRTAAGLGPVAEGVEGPSPLAALSTLPHEDDSVLLITTEDISTHGPGDLPQEGGWPGRQEKGSFASSAVPLVPSRLGLRSGVRREAASQPGVLGPEEIAAIDMASKGLVQGEHAGGSDTPPTIHEVNKNGLHLRHLLQPGSEILDPAVTTDLLALLTAGGTGAAGAGSGDGGSPGDTEMPPVLSGIPRGLAAGRGAGERGGAAAAAPAAAPAWPHPSYGPRKRSAKELLIASASAAMGGPMRSSEASALGPLALARHASAEALLKGPGRAPSTRFNRSESGPDVAKAPALMQMQADMSSGERAERRDGQPTDLTRPHTINGYRAVPGPGPNTSQCRVRNGAFGNSYQLDSEMQPIPDLQPRAPRSGLMRAVSASSRFQGLEVILPTKVPEVRQTWREMCASNWPLVVEAPRVLSHQDASFVLMRATTNGLLQTHQEMDGDDEEPLPRHPQDSKDFHHHNQLLVGAIKGGQKGAMMLFRGFRVRMGLHTGVPLTTDVTFNNTTGHMAYSGMPLKIAKAVGDGAAGGSVLLSNTTFKAVHPHLAELPGHAEALYCGDAQIELTIRSLYMLHAREHTARLGYLAPLRNLRLLQRGNLEAPVGTAAICFMTVAGATKAVAELGQPAVTALMQFKSIVTRECCDCGGYVVEATDGLCLAAFMEPAAAAIWALRCKEALAAHPWPAEVLTSPHFREVREFTKINRGRGVPTRRVAAVICRGPRIRTGIAVGPVTSEVSSATARLAYRGKVMNRSARVAAQAADNQVLMSDTAWQRVVATVGVRALVDGGGPAMQRQLSGCSGISAFAPEPASGAATFASVPDPWTARHACLPSQGACPSPMINSSSSQACNNGISGSGMNVDAGPGVGAGLAKGASGSTRSTLLAAAEQLLSGVNDLEREELELAAGTVVGTLPALPGNQVLAGSSAGKFTLKGVAEPQELFEVRLEARPAGQPGTGPGSERPQAEPRSATLPSATKNQQQQQQRSQSPIKPVPSASAVSRLPTWTGHQSVPLRLPSGKALNGEAGISRAHSPVPGGGSPRSPGLHASSAATAPPRFPAGPAAPPDTPDDPDEVQLQSRCGSIQPPTADSEVRLDAAGGMGAFRQPAPQERSPTHGHRHCSTPEGGNAAASRSVVATFRFAPSRDSASPFTTAYRTGEVDNAGSLPVEAGAAAAATASTPAGGGRRAAAKLLTGDALLEALANAVMQEGEVAVEVEEGDVAGAKKRGGPGGTGRGAGAEEKEAGDSGSRTASSDVGRGDGLGP